MANSIFLAKLLGPYLTIVTIGILFNLKNCQKIMDDYSQSAALVYLGGILALFFGLLILLFHNTWASNWTVIITIFGWLGLIKGIWLIIFPEKVKAYVDYYRDKTKPLVIQVVIMLLIGVFLIVKGYFTIV